MNNIIKKSTIVILGLMVMALGIVLYLKSNLGVDPLTAFMDGLAKTFSISIGRASQGLMFFLIIIIFFVERKRLGIGTILNALLVGVFIDLFMNIGFLNPVNQFLAFILLISGVILLAVGIAIYISVGFGEGAVDAIMVMIDSRLNMEMKWIKILLDGLLFVLAFLLRGQIGIGTIVGMLLTGPIIGLTLKKINIIKKQRIVNVN